MPVYCILCGQEVYPPPSVSSTTLWTPQLGQSLQHSGRPQFQSCNNELQAAGLYPLQGYVPLVAGILADLKAVTMSCRSVSLYPLQGFVPVEAGILANLSLKVVTMSCRSVPTTGLCPFRDRYSDWPQSLKAVTMNCRSVSLYPLQGYFPRHTF